MNLTEKQTNFLFTVLMSFFMALTMSFIMLIVSTGFVENFFLIWVKSFIIAFFIAIPTSMLAFPLCKKIIKIIKN